MENKVKGNLPEELLHEILWKLSVKDLLRCKCVCKEWYAIIVSPSFIDHHFGHESNQEILLFQEESYIGSVDKPNAFSLYQDEERPSRVEESEFLAQMPNGHRLSTLVGPSNGVFCAVSNVGSLVVLFNPATRELKVLPPVLYDIHLGRLIFGFGFDPSTRDYKVVAFKRYGKPPHSMCVYSTSSNSWKKIEVLDSFNQISVAYEAPYYPFLHGVYHWLVLMDDDSIGILALDMRSEKFHVIQVPYCLRYRDGLLVAYGDSLAMISYEKGKKVDLWAMGRDGIWIKSLTVGLDPFQDPSWPICLWKNALFFEIETTGLIRRDLSTNRTRVIVPFVGTDVFLQGVFYYKESLNSIKGVRDGTDSVQDLFDRLPEY